MVCIASRQNESLAKALISVGVSGDSGVFSFRWEGELVKRWPGSLANG